MCDVVTVLETHNKQPEDSLQQNRYIYLLCVIMTPHTAYPGCDFSYKRCCINLMTKTCSRPAGRCRARGTTAALLARSPGPPGHGAASSWGRWLSLHAGSAPHPSWECEEGTHCAQRSKDKKTGFS